MRSSHQQIEHWAAALLMAALAAGCGTTKSQQATEQLLLSDAVDRAVSSIDFRHLAGKTVYLDAYYVQPVKDQGFVNSDYIISSLRQQMFAADCRLQEKKEDAEYIVEARVGALGVNSHDVIYGMPASNLLSVATTILPGAPTLPTLPEISMARRNDQAGAAKIGVFAYHRDTKQPVWQSGVASSRSTAKDVWVMGAGPFQRGTIYDGAQFAGQELAIPLLASGEKPEQPRPTLEDYHREVNFEIRRRHKQPPDEAADEEAEEQVKQAGFEQPRKKQDAPSDGERNAQAADDESHHTASSGIFPVDPRNQLPP